MSDHSITIVPRKSSYENNTAKAQEIVNWLISKDIVKSVLSDCILSESTGYAVSEGAKKVTDFPESLPFHLTVNGLGIITNREVFHTGETGMLNCICPDCGNDIAQEEWMFIEYWFCHETDLSPCPFCDADIAIHEMKIQPPWGFSNLGFKFWNWPDFKREFIDEFQNVLNCEIVVVNQHI
jgi:hypothetical protein